MRALPLSNQYSAKLYRHAAHLVVLMASFCVPSITFGQANLNTHQHGVGRLTVVYAQSQLLLTLEAPAVNFLGFEHQPTNKAERQAVNYVLEQLRQPRTVFELSTQCDLQQTEIDAPFTASADTQNNENNEHLHNEHLHNEHLHNSSTQSHTHNQSNNSIHKDINASYLWHCDNLEAMQITVKHFDVYPRFTSITAEWVFNHAQGADTLTREKRHLNLRPQAN